MFIKNDHFSVQNRSRVFSETLEFAKAKVIHMQILYCKGVSQVNTQEIVHTCVNEVVLSLNPWVFRYSYAVMVLLFTEINTIDIHIKKMSLLVNLSHRF